jgi:hypothetical protein
LHWLQLWAPFLNEDVDWMAGAGRRIKQHQEGWGAPAKSAAGREDWSLHNFSLKPDNENSEPNFGKLFEGQNKRAPDRILEE